MSDSRKILTLILVSLLLFTAGCAIGYKEWPKADKGEDSFGLSLLKGQRQDGTCLYLEFHVSGARDRLSFVHLQLEPVGDGPGQGCPECPFMPRQGVRLSRGEAGFTMTNSVLQLSYCGLDPEVEYRFRVVGVNELSSLGLVSTDIYVATP
ncbi:hypothetical protein [Salidesulfovibrio onnuriiensis]|uniref:hypothetical protein n=1 Tax=Salidesulfovibrio onnuriiensis TaxID=2583823 RepID=UPI0011CA24C4|nr:hypothetical protein [Salidesulfovibrio onnuriiensis]